MEEKYLPIGSVCLLKGGQRYVVVIGYLGVGNEEMDKVYDYMGAVYPLGVISSEVSFMFDHEQIDKVVFRGYEDEDGKEFNKKLNELSKDQVLQKMKESQAEEAAASQAAGAQTAAPVMPGTPVAPTAAPQPAAPVTPGTPGAM